MQPVVKRLIRKNNQRSWQEFYEYADAFHKNIRILKRERRDNKDIKQSLGICAQQCRVLLGYLEFYNTVVSKMEDE